MRGCFRHFTEKYRQTENQEQTASHESQCRTRVLTRVTESVLTTDIKPAPIKLIGTADNDSFVAALQNDYEIDGLGGIDVVTFSGAAQEWGLQASTTGWLLEGAQAQGVHSLTACS